MTDDNRTSRKGLQTFLQGAQRIHVDIVGRLIEKQYVAFLLQRQGQLQAVALTTRKHTAELALIGSREVESRDIGSCVHITSAKTQGLVALRDDFVNRLLRIDVLVLLVHIGKLHGLTHLEVAAVGLLQSHDEAEEGSLSGSVRTDDTHDAVRRKHEVEVIEEHLLSESLLYVLSLDHLVA